MKAKLEVIRINEDVISTSNLCKHPNANHVKISGLNDINSFSVIAYNAINKNYDNDVKPKLSFIDGNKNSGDYYYDDGQGNLYYCDGDHDFSKYAHCLAAGTKITMADGSFKAIENIVKGDKVLTFNHEKSEYEGQKVYLAWKSDKKGKPFTLHFTNNINISVIGDHCFFEKENLKYVSIFENDANKYVGKHFYNAATNNYEELLSVTYETETVDYYEIYTEFNANCIAENMLNVAYDSSEMLNIYKFNEDLSIDHKQLENDINEFGLYEYSNDSDYSKEIYEMLNLKYINILFGKGLMTLDEGKKRINTYLKEYR